jgi:hypothetical protein
MGHLARRNRTRAGVTDITSVLTVLGARSHRGDLPIGCATTFDGPLGVHVRVEASAVERGTNVPFRAVVGGL